MGASGARLRPPWGAVSVRWGEIQERELSISRLEEAHPDGWLGRARTDESERGFDKWRDEPSDREERES